MLIFVFVFELVNSLNLNEHWWQAVNALMWFMHMFPFKTHYPILLLFASIAITYDLILVLVLNYQLSLRGSRPPTVFSVSIVNILFLALFDFK
jgi:chromate transport protein ChrA